MNIQQLEYTIAVDQFKSFSKAAQYCNITQATLSTMIKKLEDELNIVIFDRKTQPVITTDIGASVILQAKKVVLEISKLKELTIEAQSELSGMVRLGVIPTIASSLLPVLVQNLSTHFPLLRFEIIEITTKNILKQLQEGNIDAGILATPLNIPQIEEDVLYYEKLMVYGNENIEKDYLLPKELKNYKIWLLEEGHCMRNQVMQWCTLKENQIISEAIHFEANSLETLVSLVDTIGGLTLLPELYCRQLDHTRKQKLINFSAPFPVREISLIYYRPFAKQLTLKYLSEAIKKWMNPILDWKKHKLSDLEILGIG